MNENSVFLKLSSSMSDDQLVALTRDLIRDARDGGINLNEPEVGGDLSERGGPVSVGELLMVFITSGAAVSLIGCLQAYISRDKTLKVNIKKSDGNEINIDASNVDMKQTLEAVRQLTGG
jgi:hypothetical protein